MVQSDFYAYVIRRPNGIPCYVGKGRGRRCHDHANKTHNKWLGRIYEKYGSGLRIVKSKECLTNAEASEIETLLIAEYGRADLGLGSLVNHTNGGDGATGGVMSAEGRQRLSDLRKGKPRPPHVIKAMQEGAKAYEWTAEHRAKMSALNKGKTRTAEFGQRQSVARQGKPLSAETKRKLSEVLLGRSKGVPKSPEMRAKLSAAKMGKPRANKLPPEVYAKIAAKNRGKKRPLEATAKTAAALRGRKRPEEVLAKMRAAWVLRKARSAAAAMAA